MQLFVSQDVNWWTGVMWITLIFFFYQVFGLWRHPFAAEDPLASKWCNTKLLKICSDEETNISTSWVALGCAHFHFWVNHYFNQIKIYILSYVNHMSRIIFISHSILNWKKFSTFFTIMNTVFLVPILTRLVLELYFLLSAVSALAYVFVVLFCIFFIFNCHFLEQGCVMKHFAVSHQRIACGVCVIQTRKAVHN